MNNQLQIWAFSAQGNYSTDFGWDNGMDGIVYPINSMFELKHAQNLIASGDAKCEDECIFIENENNHGGSRSMNGYILANDQNSAQLKLNRYCHLNYEVVEYEQDVPEYNQQ